jgi:hypothetical protein
MKRRTVPLLVVAAFLPAAWMGCDYGVGYDEAGVVSNPTPVRAGIRGPMYLGQPGIETAFQDGLGVEPIPGNEGPLQQAAEPVGPAFQVLCFDGSTGTLRLVPCTGKQIFPKGGSNTGHDDPEPWYPGAPGPQP